MKISALTLSAALALSVPLFSLAQTVVKPLTGLPVATSESVGISPERLDNLHKLMQDEIDHHRLAGAITLLARVRHFFGDE